MYSLKNQLDKTLIPKITGLFLILMSYWNVTAITNTWLPGINDNQGMFMSQFGSLFLFLFSVSPTDANFFITIEIINLFICVILEVIMFRNQSKIVIAYCSLAILIIWVPYLGLIYSSYAGEYFITLVTALKVIFTIPYVFILVYYYYLESKDFTFDGFLNALINLKFYLIKRFSNTGSRSEHKQASHKKNKKSISSRSTPISHVDDHLHTLEDIINENSSN